MRVIIEEISGFKGAIKGMRYPMNSEHLSDSNFDNGIKLGEKDLDLLIRLSIAGSAHRKVLRCLHIGLTVAMPFTWWKHLDTYKVGTTEISRSTMHKGVGKELLTRDDFHVEEWNDEQEYVLNKINDLQVKLANATESNKKKKLWRRLIDILPLSLLQERYLDLNYENALSMLHLRYQVEKLSPEWDFFCEELLKGCPYLKDIYNATKSKRQLTTEEFDALKKKVQ